jgi:heme A synthase
MHVTLTGVGVIFVLLAVGFGTTADGKWFRFYSIGTILMLLAPGILGFLYVTRLGQTSLRHGSGLGSASPTMATWHGRWCWPLFFCARDATSCPPKPSTNESGKTILSTFLLLV